MFRILVVADEVSLANKITWAIEDAGYAIVGPERSIDAALQTLRRFQIDLAILDVWLGPHAVFPVAALLTAKQTPFVLLTGPPAGFLPLEYRDRPTVTKACSPADIVAQVKRALGNRSAAAS